MTKLSPTARLEQLLETRELGEARETVGELLGRYEEFLDLTNHSEPEIIELFLDRQKSKDFFRSANVLGDLTFQAVEQIGRKSEFHRVVVV